MTTEPPLDEKIVAITRAFDTARIDHAFGGALALAYYAEPRATIDVDVNVFVPPRRAGRTLDTVAGLGATVDRSTALAEAHERGQVRVRWGRSPIDLFFAYDAFHEACHQDRRPVPFGDARIPILAAEHLIVCKAVFDRRKDWLDIEQVVVVTARELRVDEVRGWMERIAGPDDRRTRRLERLIVRTIGSPPASGRTPRR